MVAKSARFLAPIALIAVALGVYLVVHNTLAPGHAALVQSTSSSALVQGRRQSVHHPKRTPKFYTVKSGDTLSAISSSTGVSLSKLIQLNPRLANSQNSLQVGQRLRLRR
ncbi:MAG: LysM peptidoglycan-binding domain-containing protein [Solirubrobacteraceae bacterium]